MQSCFLHRGEKKSTQCAIGNPEGPQETGKQGNREGGRREKSRRFLTCNSFDDDGGGGDDEGGGSAEETAYETEREPHGNHFLSVAFRSPE